MAYAFGAAFANPVDFSGIKTLRTDEALEIVKGWNPDADVYTLRYLGTTLQGKETWVGVRLNVERILELIEKHGAVVPPSQFWALGWRVGIFVRNEEMGRFWLVQGADDVERAEDSGPDTDRPT